PVHATASDPAIAHAAALLDVSPSQLLQALPVVKRAATARPLPAAAAVTALADRLHVSRPRAEQALTYLFGATGLSGKTRSVAPPEPATSALAARLGMTRQRAVWVFDQLNRLARPGQGVDPHSTAFAQLAAALGRTPTQLTQALDEWKQGMRAASPSPSP